MVQFCVMQIAEVRKWLNSPADYSAGVRLLRFFGKDKFLIKILEKGETGFNREKLVEALGKIASPLTPLQKRGERFEVRTKEKFLSLPEVVQKLIDEKDGCYKEMSFLHSGLMTMEEKERGEAAFKILDLDDQLRSLWEKLDYYEMHKKLPEEPVAPAPETLTPAQQVQRRNNLRSYISRTKEGAGKDDEIAAWGKELEEINKIIKT